MLGLIEKAAEAGIILYTENGQLQYRQLGDEFPDSIRKEIKEEKDNIIAYLTKKNVDGLQQESRNIVQLLEDRLKETPNKTALIFGSDSITYKEFSVQVENLAKYIALNAKGKPVALLLDRGINAMIAIFAALRANIAYVPIDPANPQERINYFLKDSESNLLLAEQKYAHVSEHFNAKFAVINDVFEAPEGWQVQLPEVSDIEENSPAYIIYTSGSTGEPKGVVCSHDNLIHFGKAMTQQFAVLGLDNDEKWLWNASYAFDASIKGVVALAQGKTIVVPNELDVKDPKAIIQIIQRQNIQVINTAPIVMKYLLPHLESTKTHVHIIVSGDDVDKQLWDKLYEYSVSCDRKVINAYGPTEASVNASYELQVNNSEVSIGKAVIGTKLYVLDKHGHTVSEGDEGELYITGPGVALGYLNRDEETESNFVVLSEFKTRAFKTGDLVKQLSNGRLQFSTRIDNQVKYRGYRVELDEIKATLKRYVEISDAAVIAHQEGGELRIDAYIVAEEIELSMEGLAAYLNKSLPEYMHPTKFNYIDEIPLTAGGKIDRNRLIGPELIIKTNTEKQGIDVASRLTVIWLEVLKVPEVKPEDNFFQVGGHSLVAMELLQNIDLEFGVVMEVRELFSRLTLQSQIDWITENLSDLENDVVSIAGSCESSVSTIDEELIGESNEKVELEL